jgi:hypothetical protein
MSIISVVVAARGGAAEDYQVLDEPMGRASAPSYRRAWLSRFRP